MKAIERNSNYLRPHGSYMEDWTDDGGMIWKHVMSIPSCVARMFLSCALVWQEREAGEYLSDIKSADEDFLTWLNVGNKDIVVYQVSYDSVHAITCRDGRMCLITADIERVEKYAKRSDWHLNPHASEARLLVALETLQYESTDTELLRCF